MAPRKQPLARPNARPAEAGDLKFREPVGFRDTGREVSPPPLTISSVSNRGVPTARKLLLLRPDALREAEAALHKATGLKAQTARQSGGAAPAQGYAKIYPHLGVAVLAADSDQLKALLAAQARGAAPFGELEDEVSVYTADMDPAWLRGYRDATNHIADTLLEDGGRAAGGARAAAGTPAATWGVLATRALESTRTGKGVRIAILDTGIDGNHPDFRDRAIVSESFIPGEAVADGNGHGTHCAGIACGVPGGTATRYGIAGAAELHVAKVLSNLGEGPIGAILHGIEWAIEKKCRVASMSLSAQGPRSPLFEQVGLRAMEAGTLLIAAAGNDSNRPDRLIPVGYPANSNSILAVAALDRQFGVARFSNIGGDGGGRIDIAGPGVGVMSSWAGGRQYRQESGTSMATPFAAGVAAQLAEADPGADARTLARRLISSARALPQSRAEDVGAGIVQSPG